LDTLSILTLFAWCLSWLKRSVEQRWLQMIQAVRTGTSLRQTAQRFGVSKGTVAYWVERSRGKRLDRLDLSNSRPGRAWNRTTPALEQRILNLRHALRHTSVLGEYGAQAIQDALTTGESPPSLATINRVLRRHGLLDQGRRQRRAAPPKGWYLPTVAAAQAELDSFDLIEELKDCGWALGLDIDRYQRTRCAARRLGHG
jgi:transposase-like protein